MTPKQVLWELSFANVCMYSATIPRYKGKKDKDGKKEEQGEGLDAFEGFFNE